MRPGHRRPRVTAGRGSERRSEEREGLSPPVVETAAMAQNERSNVSQAITDTILADLEHGCAPWDSAAGAVQFTIPRNVSTQRPYPGSISDRLVGGHEGQVHGTQLAHVSPSLGRRREHSKGRNAASRSYMPIAATLALAL